MTKEQLKQNAAAMLAAAEGKPIQTRENGDSRWSDLHPSYASWNCQWNEYRPKPEPVSRPWSKPEHVPAPICWLRMKIGGGAQLVTFIGNSTLCFGGSNFGWSDLDFNLYEYSTDRVHWSKCEVTEEPK